MALRRFALLFGIAFLAFGILGFVPVVTPMHPPGETHGGALKVTGPGHGDLLGLFHVNVLHNIVHALFGVLGLAASRSISASRGYAKLVAVSYALLAVMGLIPSDLTRYTFGLVPIHGHDVWLHVLLALPAFYFGFIYRPREVLTTTGTATYTTTDPTGRV